MSTQFKIAAALNTFASHIVDFSQILIREPRLNDVSFLLVLDRLAPEKIIICIFCGATSFCDLNKNRIFLALRLFFSVLPFFSGMKSTECHVDEWDFYTFSKMS